MHPIEISTALTIEGWCAETELTWLAERAQTAQVIVEVGSHLGRSTRALADNTLGTLIKQSERLTILQRFIQNLDSSHTAQNKRLMVWQQDHSDITPQLIKATFGEQFRPDLIFIDGHHEYPNVRHDIQAWYPFLADGGLICGHDSTQQYPGLVRAVLELLPEAQQAVGAESLWAYRAE
jgi:predicted O-methyltransferase YrrM